MTHKAPSNSKAAPVPGARMKLVGIAVIALVSFLSFNILISSNKPGPVNKIKNVPNNPVAIRP